MNDAHTSPPLDAYRAWLVSELQLLGNASHHAYSFGQANMAQRAIEKLDETRAGAVVLTLARASATAALAALGRIESRDPDLHALETALRDASGSNERS